MCAEISISSRTSMVTSEGRRRILAIALCVAALANALVPVVWLANARMFGDSNPHNRIVVAGVMIVEYAVGLLLLLANANIAFAGGYVVACGAIVTLASAILALATIEPGTWDWTELYAVIAVLGGFAFALLSNIVLLVTSIRYARAVNRPLHIGGFSLGIATSLAVLFFYSSILE